MHLAFGLALWWSLLGATPHEWEKISDKEGIEVWRKEVPSSAMLMFRGQAVVAHPILDVLAILYDNDHRSRWMARTADNHLVEELHYDEAILYSQILSGVPLVENRDIVYHVKIYFRPNEHDIYIPFHSVVHPHEPKRKDFVRMPLMLGHWRLEYVGPQATRVTYEVMGDPGGMIPPWLANIAATNIPHFTLNNLRTNVGKTWFSRAAEQITYLFDWKLVTTKPAVTNGVTPQPMQ